MCVCVLKRCCLLCGVCSSEPPPGAVAQLLERATSAEERAFLSRATGKMDLHATLLPIYSVGVQVSASHTVS